MSIKTYNILLFVSIFFNNFNMYRFPETSPFKWCKNYMDQNKINSQNDDESRSSGCEM